MYALMIKEQSEGWGPAVKNRLAAMGPVSENLDGHTLEYCRKMADQSNATDVIIIYYTDGEMPAANATEEREILEREVKTCKRKGYHLLGVGINTNSPKRYGMKTIRVDSDEDIKLVVEQLEIELTQ
jgi:acetolactate synthase regulatory subunit